VEFITNPDSIPDYPTGRATKIAHDAADTIQFHPLSVDKEKCIVIVVGPEGVGCCTAGYDTASEPLTDVLMAAQYMAESLGLTIAFQKGD
jgi:hypothetical protein